MKRISEREFEVAEGPEVRADLGIKDIVKKALSALKSFDEARDVPDCLSARLRRDAGIDEMEMEYRRIARAPLIR